MIIDSLESFEKYLNLHKDFDKVYDFIKSNKLVELESGLYPIVENDVWCVIWEGEPKAEVPKLESHDSFVEIHILLEGQECVGFKDRVKCNIEEVDYDEANDRAFYLDSPEAYIDYGVYNFIICFPKDAHSPLIGDKKLKKAIFKVRL